MYKRALYQCPSKFVKKFLQLEFEVFVPEHNSTANSVLKLFDETRVNEIFFSFVLTLF